MSGELGFSKVKFAMPQEHGKWSIDPERHAAKKRPAHDRAGL
jgi:hypothetical protein